MHIATKSLADTFDTGQDCTFSA